LTNKKGEVISWSSAGKMGLEVLKEHSCSQMAAEDCKVAIEAGLKSEVYVKGPGNGRESDCGGIEVTKIIDVTQCLTMDVVLQRDVEFNNIFNIR
jgi:small subunit ribosomal protein S11